MGWNTTVVVLNDALDQIKNDPKFGEKLYYACLEVQRGKPVDVSAGYHCNAATVIETHHADIDVLVRVGGNYGEVVPNASVSGAEPQAERPTRRES